MSKAILVIDMPESCKECMCYVLGANNNFCEITRYAIFDNVTKPSHCPLKPVPKMQKSWSGDEMDAWIRGYNNCVREIMGTDAE